MSATWYCQRCQGGHFGNCPVTGMADNPLVAELEVHTPLWNERQLLNAIAEYLDRGSLRPLLDLGFLSKADIAVGVRVVAARLQQLEGDLIAHKRRCADV